MSKRFASRKASSGSNACYNDAMASVFRLSITKQTFGASEYWTSSNSRISSAHSILVRRDRTLT
ncbi:hypothetical protein NSQ20_21475 [Paenibacillus sp. FSL K6-1122]|uniref:hypothetical protein n=1 Tax=Paenibacillus sp. FSL K6-1122 TaxID=2954512 RepID=UPI0030EDE8DE